MKLAIGLLLGLGVAVVLIRALENRMIFFPPQYPEGFVAPEAYGLEAEEVWFTTSDGLKLNAWYFPNRSSSRVLLCFHGNAENIGTALRRMKVLSALDLNLLAVDYRGYGKSEGSPDEPGIYRDAEAAYRYLVETRGFRSNDIIIFGVSLGGAVAIDLASRYECGGMIVESTFTSGRDMARRMFLIPLLDYVPKSRFDSISKIGKVRASILVIHGTRDAVIPFSMGQKLYQAAPEPKQFLAIEGAGHNDVLMIGGENYLAGLRSYVAGL